MNKKTTSIVAYITPVGLLIAFLAGDRRGARFHLNQALVIFLFALLSAVPYAGWIWGVFMCICWVLGLVYAVEQKNKEVPLIGKIHIL